MKYPILKLSMLATKLTWLNVVFSKLPQCKILVQYTLEGNALAIGFVFLNQYTGAGGICFVHSE